jgi:hypothetical protein
LSDWTEDCELVFLVEGYRHERSPSRYRTGGALPAVSYLLEF